MIKATGYIDELYREKLETNYSDIDYPAIIIRAHDIGEDIVAYFYNFEIQVDLKGFKECEVVEIHYKTSPNRLIAISKLDED